MYSTLLLKNEILNEHNINLVNKPISGKYDAIILAVAHDEFKKLSLNEIKNLEKNSIIYDIKYLLNYDEVDGRI